MDRLHQSASTRFPSRIRIVTTVIPFPLILFWLTALHKRNYFWVVTKSFKLYASLPAKKLLSLQRTLADDNKLFYVFRQNNNKMPVIFGITITLKKKYLDSIRHLMAASLKMFSPFFRYILSLHIIGVNVMFKPSKYKDMCTLIRNSTSSESYLPCTQLDHE